MGRGGAAPPSSLCKVQPPQPSTPGQAVQLYNRPVDDVHLAAVLGEEGGLLHGRVAACGWVVGGWVVGGCGVMVGSQRTGALKPSMHRARLEE